MASLDVRNLRVREEFLDSGNGIIPDVSAFRASNNERRTVILHSARFPVREISHVIERSTQDGQRDAEFHRLVLSRTDQVGQQELANRERLVGYKLTLS